MGNIFPMIKDAFNRKKFKELIDASGLSMREISIRSFVSEGYVKNLASGALISPTLDKFIRICKTLNISPDILAPDLKLTLLINVDEAIEQAVSEILGASKTVKNITAKQKAQLIIARYQQIIENK